MKLYKLKSGALIESDGKYYLHPSTDWDILINDDDLYGKLNDLLKTISETSDAAELMNSQLEPPIGSQELWACGVTYYKSKVGRQEESKASGGGDFYAKVYEAPRPEVFFKATSHRVVGHGGMVRIRKDSTWDVPEPELTLLVTSSGKIVGYTIGNDMSSRSIEGENPLYLPQAKTYDGSASLGPCIFVTQQPFSGDSKIQLVIRRNGTQVFEGTVTVDQMKRTPEELVSYVYKECSFPVGCFVMTGTGIVPSSEFTLQSGDEINISIDHIGVLINSVR